MPCASVAAIASASRTEPPGSMMAVMPALAASSTESGKGKKASEAITVPRARSPARWAAAFDTRFALESIDSSTVRFIVKTGGYAASTIAKELKKRGGNLVAAPEGFLVTGEKGPLKEGELERAKEWGRGLGQPG